MAREESISAQPVLLGLLMDRPRHGYELYQEFQGQPGRPGGGLGSVWQIGLSQLYAQLHNLEEAGLVVAHTEPQDNRPPRKVYALSDAGRDAFLDWVRQPTPYLRRVRVEFLARLYFYHCLALPGLQDLVEAQAGVCRAQMERFAHLAAAEDDPFRRMVLEFRLGQLQAVLDWLQHCVLP